MNTHHTPGPWSALEFAGSHPSVGVCVGNSSPADSRSKIKYWIATLPLAKAPGAGTSIQDAGASADEARANARLIAAAPDLLEMCKQVLLRLNFEHAERKLKGEQFPHFVCSALRDDLRAAIAKATGETHTATPTKVTVEVTGGVAEVTSCPAGVQVEIIDHDNQDNGGFPVQPSIFNPQPSAQ